jgi:hypothetical protein
VAWPPRPRRARLRRAPRESSRQSKRKVSWLNSGSGSHHARAFRLGKG